ENARDQILKNSNEVNVQILSIVLGNSNGIKTSTIRAKIITKNLNTRGLSESTKVITLSYDYILAKASEENRILNPLGFKVTNYRIDEEIR
ncbi:type IV secretion system protein, partial [Campylobacter jejuni]